LNPEIEKRSPDGNSQEGVELCKKTMKYRNLKMKEKVETCQKSLRSHHR